MVTFMIACCSVFLTVYYYRDALITCAQEQLSRSLQFYFPEGKVAAKIQNLKWGGLKNPLAVKIDNLQLQLKNDLTLKAYSIFLKPSIKNLLSGQFTFSTLEVSKCEFSKKNHGSLHADLQFFSESGSNNIVVSKLETTADAFVNLLPLTQVVNKKSFIASMPISGEAWLRLGKEGVSGKINFHLDKGNFKLAPYYPEVISIDHGDLEIEINDKEIYFSKINISHNQTSLKASGVATFPDSLWLIKTGDTAIACQVDGIVTNANVDEINLLWPQRLAPLPREWVTENLSKGQVTQATLHADTSFVLTRAGIVKDVTIKALHGIIDAEGVNVNYFGKLPPVEQTKGHCEYTQHQFVIFAQGWVNGVELQRGHIIIHDLDKKDTYFQLNADLLGSLQNCLHVIEKPPLNLASKVGLNIDSLSGNAISQIYLMFLLKPGISLKDVYVKARSTIFNAAIKSKETMLGFDNVLEAGRFDVTIDNSKLELHGQAQLFGQPSLISWQECFEEQGVSFRRRFEINSNINLDSHLIKGRSQLNCSYNVDLRGAITATATSDLTGMAVELPWISYRKTASQPLKLILEKDEEKAHVLRIKGHKLDIIAKNKPGDMLPVELVIKKLGDLSGQFQVNYKKEQLSVAGKLDALDLRLIQDDLKSWQQSLPTLSKVDLYTNLTINKLIYSDQLTLSKMTIRSHYLDGRLMMVEALSLPDRFSFMLSPPRNNRQTFILTAADGGNIIEAFAPGYDLEGGELQVVGEQITDSNGSQITGEVDLKEVTFVKAPLLARILSLTSLEGVVRTIAGGAGIHFEHAYATFKAKDKRIDVNNMLLYGTALGLEAEGVIDTLTNSLSFKGDVVPLYSVNHFLTKIPLLGPLLTGTNKKGMFSAAFEISGDKDNLQINVSPFTTIAPTGWRQRASNARAFNVAGS